MTHPLKSACVHALRSLCAIAELLVLLEHVRLVTCHCRAKRQLRRATIFYNVQRVRHTDQQLHLSCYSRQPTLWGLAASPLANHGY